MNKFFLIIFCLFFNVGSFANVISYDPITQMYTIDQFGSKEKMQKKEKKDLSDLYSLKNKKINKNKASFFKKS